MRDFEEFINTDKDRAVVVLDVFDSLVGPGSSNFNNALFVLNQMIDLTVVNKSILFVPISSEGLNTQQKAQIENVPAKEYTINEEKPRRGFFRRKRV